MAHSVEARVPYVDLDVVAHALRLPLDTLFRDGYSKYPVRLLADQVLPAAVVWRKSKIGFEPPLEEWLATLGPRAEAQIAGSALLRRLCRVLPSYAQLPLAMRWRLYNVAAWERIYGVVAA
jgi:asparagine synthetase B (glutamine-hydrolysing)